MSGGTIFRTAGAIYAGEGMLAKAAEAAVALGGIRNALVIASGSGIRLGFADEIRAGLAAKGIASRLLTGIPAEPSDAQLTALHGQVREEAFDLYIGIGGGSVLDAAKILSVMRTNDAGPADMIGIDRIEHAGVPLILIPTTSGTGSETTPNAIVSLPERRVKTAVVSKRLYPAAAILDPLLTLDLPPDVTAATGMDALTHALESFVSLKANPISDMYALEAIRRISAGLAEAYANGSSLTARADMLYGSAFAGMALSCSGTAAVHAMAYPLGGHYQIPHGIANAMLLKHVTAFNLDKIRNKLGIVAYAMGLTERPDEPLGALEVLEQLDQWTALLSIPQDMSRYGVGQGDIAKLAEEAYGIKRLIDNNPKPIFPSDMIGIYRKLLPGNL